MNEVLKKTLRLETALRYLARNPLVRLAAIAEQYNVSKTDLDEWLVTHNQGHKNLKAELIDEVKAKAGGLVVTKTAGCARGAEPVRPPPVLAGAPAPVKLAPTSDLRKWLEAQRLKVSATVNSYQVEVSPAVASAWLHFNTGNRKPSQAKIRRFAQAMKTHKWTLNGETVKFSVSGRLIDGQSRLMALIESGVAVTLEVRAGLPDVAQESMDCGELRKGSHMLEMMGEKYPFETAAALKMVFLLEQDCWPYRKNKRTGRRVMENAEVKPLLEKHPGVKESVGYVVSDGRKIKNLMPFSEAAFFHYLFGNANKMQRDHFFESLADGIGLTKQSPVYHLREKLIEFRKVWSGQRICVERWALVIKTWNLVSKGEKVTSLNWSKSGPQAEDFPKISGLKKEAA